MVPAVSDSSNNPSLSVDTDTRTTTISHSATPDESALIVEGGRGRFSAGIWTRAFSFDRKLVDSTPYTVGETDCWLPVDTSSPKSINLPLVSYGGGGRVLFIKDATGTANINNITVHPDPGSPPTIPVNTIDNVAGDKTLTATGGAFWLVTDGTSNWEML